MSLQQKAREFQELFINTVFDVISSKYSIDREELDKLWNSEEEVKKKAKSKPKESALTDVDTDDISLARLSLCSKPELSILCKKFGKKCSGKKDELIARLLEGSDEKAPEQSSKTKTKSPKTEKKKQSKIEESFPVIKNIQSQSQKVSIRKNAFNIMEHPESSLVFDSKFRVYGKQQDDGSISELNDEDIETCKRFKFTFIIPKNLDTNATEKKIDGIDDIEESDVESDTAKEVDDVNESDVESDTAKEVDSDVESNEVSEKEDSDIEDV